jgi:hypothetical protein
VGTHGAALGLVYKGGIVKVRMITKAAGPFGVYGPGQVVEVETETAEAWIEAGFAEPAGTAEPETAEAPAAPERAVARKKPAPRKRAPKKATKPAD